MVMDTSFIKSNFCLKFKILSLPTNAVNSFSWIDRLILYIFKKMSTKHPVWISTVCQVFFQVNMGFLKKWLVQLVTHRISQVFFPWDNYLALIGSRSDFLCNFHAITQSIKKKHVQKFIFYAISNFYWVNGDTFKWSGLFSSECKQNMWMEVKNRMSSGVDEHTALTCAKVPVVLATPSFAITF